MSENGLNTNHENTHIISASAAQTPDTNFIENRSLPLTADVIESHLNQDHISLRDSFLHGDMSASEFLKAVMSLDQRNPDRDDCVGNIELLEDARVRETLLKNKDYKVIFSYHKDLGFYRFHRGQQLLYKGDNRPGAEMIQMALQERIIANEYLSPLLTDTTYDAQKSDIQDRLQANTYFIWYLTAIAEYSACNIDALQKVVDKLNTVPEDHDYYIKTQFARSLLAGLRTRGKPVYKEDYHD